MEVFAGHRDEQLAAAPSVVTIGVFDGVHLGHLALIEAAVAEGRGAGLRALALTFDPHPAHQVRPGQAPALLEPLPWRLARLAAAGLDAVVVEPFDAALAAMSAGDFVDRLLIGRLGARAVVVGEGFRFGRGQGGRAADLGGGGGGGRPRARTLAPVRVDDEVVSSSRVRAHLQAGRPQEAARLLGRPFCLAGAVEGGARRGATLGFPTANLRAANELAPCCGVYAAWAQLGAARHLAVVNIGTAPTFSGGGTARVEAHLLDYDGPPFYGAQLALGLAARLREERRFADVGELIGQIRRDVDGARAALAGAAAPSALLPAGLGRGAGRFDSPHGGG